MSITNSQKAFRQLSHIIIMKKYYVKQFPPKPIPFSTIWQAQVINRGILDPRYCNVLHYIKGLDLKRLKMEQRYAQLMNQYKKQVRIYKQEVKKYSEIYLDPLKRSTELSYFIQLEEQKVRNLNLALSQDKKIRIPRTFELEQKFYKLNQQQKLQLNVKLRDIKIKQQQQRKKYKQKYEIPNIKKSNSLLQFIAISKQNKKYKDYSQILKAYSELSAEKKGLYKQLGILTVAQRRLELQQFLHKNGLTQDEFRRIYSISSNFFNEQLDYLETRSVFSRYKNYLNKVEQY